MRNAWLWSMQVHTHDKRRLRRHRQYPLVQLLQNFPQGNHFSATTARGSLSRLHPLHQSSLHCCCWDFSFQALQRDTFLLHLTHKSDPIPEMSFRNESRPQGGYKRQMLQSHTSPTSMPHQQAPIMTHECPLSAAEISCRPMQVWSTWRRV